MRLELETETLIHAIEQLTLPPLRSDVDALTAEVATLPARDLQRRRDATWSHLSDVGALAKSVRAAQLLLDVTRYGPIPLTAEELGKREAGEREDDELDGLQWVGDAQQTARTSAQEIATAAIGMSRAADRLRSEAHETRDALVPLLIALGEPTDDLLDLYGAIVALLA